MANEMGMKKEIKNLRNTSCKYSYEVVSCKFLGKLEPKSKSPEGT